MNDTGNGWPEYQRLVMAELERHSEWLASIDARGQRLQTEIALLKLKSTLWGAAAGALASVGPVVFLIWKGS